MDFSPLQTSEVEYCQSKCQNKSVLKEKTFKSAKNQKVKKNRTKVWNLRKTRFLQKMLIYDDVTKKFLVIDYECKICRFE